MKQVQFCGFICSVVVILRFRRSLREINHQRIKRVYPPLPPCGVLAPVSGGELAGAVSTLLPAWRTVKQVQFCDTESYQFPSFSMAIIANV